MNRTEINYHFFFDEAFHDRKITSKNGKINIYSDNSNDLYLGVFIGCHIDKLTTYRDRFLDIEQKYKILLGLKCEQEFKGTTIKKRQFTYGIASFNEITFTFYSELFSLLDNDLFIHIGMYSKTAFFLEKIFQSIEHPEYTFNRPSLMYSLIKIFHNYGLSEILLKLFTDNLKDKNKVLDLLKSYLIGILEKSKNSKKKKKERDAIETILLFLDNDQINPITMSKFEWDYNEVFLGYIMYLKERNIEQKEIRLVIDREEKTAQSAKYNYNFSSVEQEVSEHIPLIRLADFIANFMGRMSMALYESLNEGKLKSIEDIESYDFDTRTLLSKDWFKLNEKQFILYKLLYNKLFITNKFYWFIRTSMYFDYTILVVSIIEYISKYDTYEAYQKIQLDKHVEGFNEFSLIRLRHRYSYFYNE